jgi:uracil-DNA glycosylase family 4
MDIDQRPSDMDALLWLIESGADEIISEQPLDRFALSLVAEKPKPAPIAPVRALTLPDQSAADAAAQAAACTNIEELIQAINYFEANPLRKSAMNLSFIEGPFQSPILVMGEKPRAEEDRSGQVFAGKTRVLLTAMLAAIDIKIEDVTLMNFIAWRPPGNRQAQESEIAMCLPFAARAIEIIKPKMILSFGALAGQHLAGGDSSLIRQRGKWQKIGDAHFMATMPPDELLKLPAQKKLAWRDLLAFKQKWDEIK